MPLTFLAANNMYRLWENNFYQSWDVFKSSEKHEEVDLDFRFVKKNTISLDYKEHSRSTK